MHLYTWYHERSGRSSWNAATGVDLLAWWMLARKRFIERRTRHDHLALAEIDHRRGQVVSAGEFVCERSADLQDLRNLIDRVRTNFNWSVCQRGPDFLDAYASVSTVHTEELDYERHGHYTRFVDSMFGLWILDRRKHLAHGDSGLSSTRRHKVPVDVQSHRNA